MSDKQTPLKVFLCHASQDKPKVRRLYEYLQRQGVQPWLDSEDLLPGQEWQDEIPKALLVSDVIVICLSKKSVDKDGYVQKEIRFALDRALEIPQGRIFLIPARLEECEVPFNLTRYHWVDLFEDADAGYSKLFKSLTFRAEQLERVDDTENKAELQKIITNSTIQNNETMEIREKVKTQQNLNKVISLQNRIAEIVPNVGSLTNWNKSAIDKIDWMLRVAKDCHLLAKDYVSKKIEKDLANIRDDAVDIYTTLGLVTLDCITLYINSRMIPLRYELDTFDNVFRNTNEKLLAIWQIDSDSVWQNIKAAKRKIDALKTEKELASASLKELNTQIEELNDLEERLIKIDIKKEWQNVAIIEETCAEYWYPYDENDTTWKLVLGDSPPPSTMLSQLRTIFKQEIYPEIQPGMIIRQSNILPLIQKISIFLETYKNVSATTNRLAIELNKYKVTEKNVKSKFVLFTDPGYQDQLINQLNRITGDTSPEIREEAFQYLAAYQNYRELATKVKGANYPKLSGNLAQLANLSKSLLKKHSNLLAELETDCTQSAGQMRKDLTDITELMSITPAVEPEICKQLERLEKAGYPILDNFHPSAGYNSLNTSFETMQAWLLETVRYLDPARVLNQAFKEARNEAVTQLRAIQSQINQQSYSLQYKWGWVKSAMAPEIESIQSKLDMELKNWNRHEGRKWAEMNQMDAIAYCEQIISLCDEILSSLDDVIETINKEQRRLQEKEKAIRRIAMKNMYGISLEEIYIVEQLCNIAHIAESHELVTITLKRAEQIATNIASYQERQQTKTIINIVGRGYIGSQTIINNSSGAYVEGNVSTSGGDFIGRDDKKQTIFVQALFPIIEKLKSLTIQEQNELKHEIETLQKLVIKKKVDENMIFQYLQKIESLSPDVLEVVLLIITNPTSGFGDIAEKAVRKFRSS